jgi:predicted ATPase
VLAHYDPVVHRSLVYQVGIHPHLNAQVFLGIILFCLGFPDQALVLSNAAIAEARKLAHAPTLAGNLAVNVRLLSLTGDYATLDERARQLVAVATEQGFPLWRALGAIFSGWVAVRNGDVTDGMSLLRRGSTAYHLTGAELATAYYTALLAGACEIAGQVEESSSLLDDALQIVEGTKERWLEAELYRLKGQLLLRQGHWEAAEEFYRKSITIAVEQKAKLWELRATTNLARLWSDQGRVGEARDMLAPVYGWFTEGFDTPDLKEAKALLNDLS